MNKREALLTLNVNHNSSQEEIKTSYRKMALELHPDKNGGNREKSDKYKKITEAYKFLTDESNRKKYDFSLVFAVSPITKITMRLLSDFLLIFAYPLTTS